GSSRSRLSSSPGPGCCARRSWAAARRRVKPRMRCAPGCDPRCNPAARSSFSCAMVSEWLLADPLGMRQSRANGAVSTYRVFVRDLDLRCSIGIHDHEKQPQRIRISAELVVADEPDISGDALGGVLNYSPIVKGIKAIATG